MPFLRSWGKATWPQGCELAWVEAGVGDSQGCMEPLVRAQPRQGWGWVCAGENGLGGQEQTTETCPGAIRAVLVTDGQWL